MEENPREVTRWHLSIAYDGTDFYGWQVQPHNRTVQGELLLRLRLMLRAPELRIFGSCMLWTSRSPSRCRCRRTSRRRSWHGG